MPPYAVEVCTRIKSRDVTVKNRPEMIPKPYKRLGVCHTLSGYIASTGRKYKNHAATIRRWAADDTAKAAPKKGIPDYSYKEGESL